MAISISLPKVEYNSTDFALSEIRCALWRNNDTLSHSSSSWLLWQHDEGLFISSMVTWQTEPPSHREWYDWCVEAILMFMYHRLYRQQLPTVHAELNTDSLWATFLWHAHSSHQALQPTSEECPSAQSSQKAI